MATPVRLDIGSTIDASFNVVRRNPRATLLPVAAVSAVSTVVTYAALGGIAVVLDAWSEFEQLVLGIGTNPLQPSASDVGTPTNPFADVPTPDGTAIGLAVVLGLVFVLASTFLAAVSYACVVQQVGRLVGDREALPFGEAVRAALLSGLRVLPVWLTLILGGAVAYGVVLAVVVVAISALPVAAAVLLGLLVLAALVVAALYLVVRLCLFPAVYGLEGLGFGSLRRSWELTAGNVPRMALVLLVAVMLSLVIAFGVGIISAPLQLLSAGDETVGRILAFGVVVPLGMVGSILGLVAIAAPLTISYLRLRAATEGDDLALAAQRFSQSGGTGGERPGGWGAPSSQGWGADAGARAGRDRSSWDFDGGAADGSWVSRNSPPPGAPDAPDDDAERERFGRG